MDWLAHALSGPMGGLLGLSFGLGCGAGYGFAMRSIVVWVKQRLAERDAEVKELKIDKDRLIAEKIELLKDRH